MFNYSINTGREFLLTLGALLVVSTLAANVTSENLVRNEALYNGPELTVTSTGLNDAQRSIGAASEIAALRQEVWRNDMTVTSGSPPPPSTSATRYAYSLLQKISRFIRSARTPHYEGSWVEDTERGQKEGGKRREEGGKTRKLERKESKTEGGSHQEDGHIVQDWGAILPEFPVPVHLMPKL
eukprot:gb/GEZN01017855.1/.p1 GENE.gb/GEZN01017855.1/~~gb/GEZN01017855.1/.p1  ORF type:complete len:183 (-),score=14.33 gb/GEZN01017855.1/:160-708(-)